MKNHNEELWRHLCDSDLVKHCSITDFKGMTIGINASHWLETSLVSTVEELIDHNFEDFMFYVDAILSKVRNFRIAGVEPVMVFEGKRNLLKTEAQMKEEEAHQVLLDQGNRLLDHMRATNDAHCKQKLRQEAIASFQKGLRPTPEMVTNVVAALKQVGVTVFIAPCDVDAQLVNLSLNGVCQAVLSEKFDVLLYSLISQASFPIIFKFEHTGNIQVVSLKLLGLTSAGFKTLVELPQKSGLKRQLSIQSTHSLLQSLNLSALLQSHFQDRDRHDGPRLFLQICLLFGCEFVEPLPEMTLSIASEIVQSYREVPSDSRLIHIVRQLQAEGFEVPCGYLERLLRAETLYFYHPVYDPMNKTLQPFAEPNLLSLTTATAAAFSTGGCISSTCPLIDQQELLKLSLDTALLEKASLTVSPVDLFEGHRSIETFAPIVPRLPWDHPDLRPPAHMSRSKEGRLRHGVWATRQSLMKCLSPSLSLSDSQPSSQDSPPSSCLSPSLADCSPPPVLNIYHSPASLRVPRRHHRRRLSSRTHAPSYISDCSDLELSEDEQEREPELPRTPPDVRRLAQEDEGFHSPPTSPLRSSHFAAEKSCSSKTISPPSDRSSSATSPSHSVIKVLSPELDRLSSFSLPHEEAEGQGEIEGGGRRDGVEVGSQTSPQQQQLRKRRRRAGDEDVVALSLTKGKQKKQTKLQQTQGQPQGKTIYVASIKSFFR